MTAQGQEEQILAYCRDNWHRLEDAPDLDNLGDFVIVQAYFQLACEELNEFLIFDEPVEVKD